MPNTLQQEFFKRFEENLESARMVSRQKSEGYTAGTGDPYNNFRFAALMSSLPGKDTVSVEQTILSRMADKISRYKSLIVRPEAAYDESTEDTLHDLMVYSNILLTWEQLGRPTWDQVYYTDEETMGTAVGEDEPPLVAKAGVGLAAKFGWLAGKKK